MTNITEEAVPKMMATGSGIKNTTSSCQIHPIASVLIQNMETMLQQSWSFAVSDLIVPTVMLGLNFVQQTLVLNFSSNAAKCIWKWDTRNVRSYNAWWRRSKGTNPMFLLDDFSVITGGCPISNLYLAIYSYY